jgi:hypothetical protein
MPETAGPSQRAAQLHPRRPKRNAAPPARSRLADETRTAEAYGLPLPPTAPGQRVRAVSAGGRVRLWMEHGVVVRFTRVGNPVVRVAAPHLGGHVEVSDTEICFRQVDDDGQWIRRR